MEKYRDSTSNTLSSLISGAVLGAAGLAWWLFSEADRRKRSRKQRAMLYAPRMQDGSEAHETPETVFQQEITSDQLEERVEQLNTAIADVRKQLEDLGARN